MQDTWKNKLYFGDNLDVLRKHIRDESIDLVYIDPPFNSKRSYNQIYNNFGQDDRAQAQAFIDTWEWDDRAREGLNQILENEQGRYTPQTIELIKGLRSVLKESSLLAYLVSMTLRIAEIHRILKPTGSFYLHCDPTSSHYLKLVLDGVFCAQGGDFQNEIIWSYRRWPSPSNHYQRMHDVILFYSKSTEGPRTFHVEYEPNSPSYTKRFKGKTQMLDPETKTRKITLDKDSKGLPCRDVWDISIIAGSSKERLGYPTQKPKALLKRIIETSSDKGDLILDAYCGCGTTIEVAHNLKRRWIGIDITYQSVSLIMKRLEDAFGHDVLKTVSLDGIPKDMASATALAHKKDDRLRKEFEKWAVLTYSNNRASINQKKGADEGIDGVAYFMVNATDNEKIIFQVKSGNVGSKDIRDLRGTIEQQRASLGIFITLQEPTAPMIKAAHAAGTYKHIFMGRSYNRIQIITVRDMIEKGARLEMPLARDVVKSARLQPKEIQLELRSKKEVQLELQPKAVQLELG